MRICWVGMRIPIACHRYRRPCSRMGCSAHVPLMIDIVCILRVVLLQMRMRVMRKRRIIECRRDRLPHVLLLL
jgi:hypothetical protein